jgi:hypothetical protein
VKILLSAVIAAVTFVALTTAADADPRDHHAMRVCHWRHHHQVCHMVRR